MKTRAILLFLFPLLIAGCGGAREVVVREYDAGNFPEEWAFLDPKRTDEPAKELPPSPSSRTLKDFVCAPVAAGWKKANGAESDCFVTDVQFVADKIKEFF